MIDAIIAIIIAAIVGIAIAYIVRARKKGVKCIGCPAAGCCSAKRNEQTDSSENIGCCCGCSSDK